jgi:hypothetical protein
MSGVKGYNRTVTIDVPLTIDTDAYTAGDVVGGLLAIPFTRVGGGGLLRRLMVIDDDNEKTELTVYVFDQQPSTIADDAAFAPTVADLKKLIGSVVAAAADYVTLGANAIAVKANIDMDISAPVGSIWAYVVCTGTPTYAAETDLMLRLTIWVD